MALSSNADACYSLNGKLPDDPRWGRWEWGNNLMYHRCLQLAGYDWSTILCGRRALLPNFRTTAHMWAPLSFSLYFPFFLFIVFPPSQWREIKKQFSIAAFTSVKVDREWGSQPIYTLLPCCGREIEKCAEMKKSSMIDIKDARY